MKMLAVVVALALAGCNKEPSVSFYTAEFKQVDETVRKPRTTFLASERPVLFIDGRGTYGKKYFINLTFNSQGSNTSPTYTGQIGGRWTYMGHGDLLPGNYEATLYVEGEPVAVHQFKIIR